MHTYRYLVVVSFFRSKLCVDFFLIYSEENSYRLKFKELFARFDKLATKRESHAFSVHSIFSQVCCEIKIEDIVKNYRHK